MCNFTSPECNQLTDRECDRTPACMEMGLNQRVVGDIKTRLRSISQYLDKMTPGKKYTGISSKTF